MQTQVAAAPSGITLTQAGLAYCARHGREAIERRIDRHLALVTAMLSYLDAADGDPDLEPSLGFTPYCDDPATVDLEGGDVDTTEISDLEWYGESDGLEHGEHDPGDYDNDLHIPGGGSGRL